MVTEAKKRSNAKWDRENMTTLGCRMRRDYAEEFKAACRMAGKTPNAIFKAAADQFMEDHRSQSKTEE